MINNDTDCLLIIDVQNDFCPGGALGVEGGDQVVSIINSLPFGHRVLTQDWHPADHHSFASSHPDRTPFSSIQLDYGEQVLWPDHCVQGSPGAAFHASLETSKCELVLRKGFRSTLDSYSAFFENDQTTPTGLGGYLRARNFQRVFVCGLTTDFCVGYSALDARRLDFEVYLIDDACRAIDRDGSLGEMHMRMAAVGVEVFNSVNLQT